ncbi:DUF6160 family protein [Agitococcus lubricus]|uniref:DUF6160 domain-containing protein n=1 Tax=Agitococcus lubricus TaxID=1077255 RepID=A0A2T5IZN9_9GAMM|nr:DUF6160 family protein [Agitococcus lubricus]PTQ89527.1 hypothetical protein C8N29_10658 [Agitococcus lubricus]
MNKYKKSLLCLCLSSISSGVWADKVPLDDQELRGTTGQAGVALDLEMRLNANADGSPLAAAPYNSCTGLNGNNACRMAWQANNRTNEWLVYKNFYMVLKLNNLRLDATTLPSTSSVYADANRFKDSTGACILAGCTPNGLPALKLSFAGNATTTEVDYEILANGVLSMEVSAAGYSASTNPGYNGFRVADSNGAYVSGQNLTAKIDIDGRVLVYGF